MRFRHAIHMPLLTLLCLLTLHGAAQYVVEHIPEPYNTPGSETGAIRVGDTILAYSSMQPTHGKQGGKFGFALEQMHVYQARIARSGKIAKPRPSRWGINTKRDHTGNIALDPQTHDLYFTRCRLDDPNLRCEIWWARRLKRGWDKPQRLRGHVNLKDYTATQPTICRLPDGTAMLIFCSDRPDGLGGLDLWQATVQDGVASEPTNLGPQVNSTHDEITPFYDQSTGVLYFSSDRPGGLGGFDIYSAPGCRNTWQTAAPVCHCINSPQNDIYFSISDHDSATGIPSAGFLSSNRPDSYYLVDSLCCNDIYRWSLPQDSLLTFFTVDTLPPTELDSTPPTPRRFVFPLFLYFHNDDPDPRSRDSVTTSTYTECWHRYSALRSAYIAHQTTADDSLLMSEFFDSCVDGNYHRIGQLFDYIEEQLDDGHTVRLEIAGFASPVYTDAYNHALSARRIAAFLNMVRQWRGGVFDDAMAARRLNIVQRASGIDRRASSRSSASHTRPSDPIYSLEAAQSRRIEITAIHVSD